MAKDVTKIGAGAVVGGIVGGIIGGGKGALIGVLVGGGGTMAATDGTEVDLPAGTVLRIRVDQPLEISVRMKLCGRPGLRTRPPELANKVTRWVD